MAAKERSESRPVPRTQGARAPGRCRLLRSRGVHRKRAGRIARAARTRRGAAVRDLRCVWCRQVLISPSRTLVAPDARRPSLHPATCYSSGTGGDLRRCWARGESGGRLPGANTAKSRAAISQALQAPGGFDSLLVELQTLARSRLEGKSPAPTLVISVDQGEELFSAEGRTEAERFLDLLALTLASPKGDGPEALPCGNA